MSKHAILGASSATRWINCPGSVNLIASLPHGLRSRTSIEACEGNAAHDLAEACLIGGGDSDLWGPDHTYLQNAAHALGKKIRVDEWPEPFKVDHDMAEAVQVYLDHIQTELARLGDGTRMWVERSVRPFYGRADMWGTADCILLQPFGELIVMDYKHGKGVVVEADWNDQMMFYGLGTLDTLGDAAADVSSVTLVIVQPRAYHHLGEVRPWTTTAQELYDFGDTLRLAADATYKEDAPLVAGDHCRFCPAKGVCPALREDALALFNIHPTVPESTDPPTVPHDPAEVARLLKIIPRWDVFVKGVTGVAMRMAENGTKLPGFKIVRKKANRRWEDPVLVEKRLRRRQGVKAADIFKPRELRSPRQLEKVKAVGKPWVGKHAVKPKGGLTLVEDSDKRPAVEVTPVLDLLPATTEE